MDRPDEAVPGVAPSAPGTDGADALLLEVDGERFRVTRRPTVGRERHDYTWLTGPNSYGFAVSGPAGVDVAEHRRRIADFLAEIDPATGYLAD